MICHPRGKGVAQVVSTYEEVSEGNSNLQYKALDKFHKSKEDQVLLLEIADI